MSTTASPATRFGHPAGLSVLFGTEMWERFSYYGMRALLVLYMTKYLLLEGRADAVIGFAGLRSALESVFGPLETQPLASQIYGLYTGLVYFTPVLGGLLSDRVLGPRRTIILGALLMAAGHFLMALEGSFLIALLLLILGNGTFKPNISTQVGQLYPEGDSRRDRAYSIFYVGINLGAFLAPLVCGTLGESLGWHYGFTAAGVGMLIALGIYLTGQRHLPPELPPRARASGRSGPAERRTLIALLLLCVPVSLFWATYEQSGNTISLWADGYTDRHIDLGFWRGEIPTTWFQAFNPFMIFAFTPLVVSLWSRQAARGREPGTLAKMALGCLGVALANVILALAGGGPGPASWLWLLAYFVVLTLGELYLSPIGLSLISAAAPPGRRSMMMGIWLGTSFAGNFMAGWLGSFWVRMEKPVFFLMIAAVAAAAAGALYLANRPLARLLNAHGKEGVKSAPAAPI
jgi:POT family proton-dependent oligopeptide transporter